MAPTITWNDDFGYVPADPAQQLDVVYNFKAPHTSETIGECAYKDWECDYYVMLKSDKYDTLPEGSITLGGNYGSWGWIGFDNPEVATNTEIPLLGSVTKVAWTYESIVNFVGEFDCGVGATAQGAEYLEGAQFVVMLRLTNPETGVYYNVATITYDF